MAIESTRRKEMKGANTRSLNELVATINYGVLVLCRIMCGPNARKVWVRLVVVSIKVH